MDTDATEVAWAAHDRRAEELADVRARNVKLSEAIHTLAVENSKLRADVERLRARAGRTDVNVLSLFSGIGGLDLGLERAGMTVVGQVEIDPFCRAVLAKHWPEVPRHDDVRTCVEWWLGSPRPAVDVVAGGFPCQPVSTAGRQRAQADERWLWPAFAAVIRDLRPRYAIMENVPGLLARGMGDVLGDLAACGYDAQWDCAPAAAVGAPHRRDRVFVVAYPGHRAVAERTRIAGRTPGQRPTIGSEPGSDGPPKFLAHPEGERREQRQRTQAARRLDATRGGAAMADPPGWGVAVHVHLGGGSWRPERSDWWAIEPPVGRVAHGVPGRVDRLRALGNAVVPQVAEHVGRLVMEAAA